MTDHTLMARAHTAKYPQYARTEQRARRLVVLHNIGKVGGPNWLKAGDISLGYFDEAERLHVYSAYVDSWCICTLRPRDKVRFREGV